MIASHRRAQGKAKLQLHAARQTLSHLVQLYDTGVWKRLYNEAAFAKAVRKARQAVDHWNDVVAQAERV